MDDMPKNPINKVYYLKEALKIVKRLDPEYAKKLSSKIKILDDYYMKPLSIKPELDEFTKKHL